MPPLLPTPSWRGVQLSTGYVLMALYLRIGINLLLPYDTNNCKANNFDKDLYEAAAIQNS
jgi:hypothetical protein